MNQTTPANQTTPTNQRIEPAPEESRLRPLPDDPVEFENAIRLNKVMVRPVLLGVSQVFKAFKLSPLGKDEQDAGAQAFGALLYQYKAEFDARLLVILWILGITLPRVVEWANMRHGKMAVVKQTVDAAPMESKAA